MLAHRWPACIASLLATACAAGSADPISAPPAPDLREVIFRGACDASGAVPLSESRFVVADDEDNILRVYDADRGGAPLFQTDVSPMLGLPLEGKKAPRAAELDLEAATRIGDRAYWLTSHGRNKKAKRKPARLRFFATTTPDDHGHIAVAGQPYDDLLRDIIADPGLAPFDLAAAAQRAPKAEGGLNIEGLTAAPDGTVMLAFRNPVPQGRALLVPLLNARELVEAPGKGPARFGEPVLLDLGGRGVRALSWWRGQYLIVAGDHAAGGTSAIFTWAGGDGEATAVDSIDLGDYNPEGFFTPEGRDEFLVVSDDGTREIDGAPCKKQDAIERKQFRGVWLSLPER